MKENEIKENTEIAKRAKALFEKYKQELAGAASGPDGYFGSYGSSLQTKAL